ncbi:hypothetical protein chiPu_0010225 [Chiloscyllium punctatum]|uniref:Uncharacterized protein n=1 Tax=Chiloscyllium punctatum TaxID=137246 RepID=A0A401SMW8_CHIPU|nr:hypothetical protein [Chiloscyllium punctatum]
MERSVPHTQGVEMAAVGSAVCVAVLQLVLLDGVASYSFPANYTIQYWAGRIEQELDRVVRQVSGIQQLKALEFWLIAVQSADLNQLVNGG